MNKLKLIWNGKVKGVLGALFILISSSCRSVLDLITTFLVKNNVKSVGKNVLIQSGFTYRYPGNIEIGNKVSIARGVTFISENKNGQLKIEDNVVITFDVRIDFSGTVVIGKNTLISKNTSIETHDHGLDPLAEPEYKKLIVGENVWIGMNSIILSDVRSIGSNSIIAAGSIVTKAVPSNCIVGGIPAKIIKHR